MLSRHLKKVANEVSHDNDHGSFDSSTSSLSKYSPHASHASHASHTSHESYSSLKTCLMLTFMVISSLLLMRYSVTHPLGASLAANADIDEQNSVDSLRFGLNFGMSKNLPSPEVEIDSCLLCDALIPKDKQYIFISHHKTGRELSSNIQNYFVDTCCSNQNSAADEHSRSNTSDASEQFYTSVKQRLLTSNVNNKISENWMYNTLEFNKTNFNDARFLERINNTIYFHFNRMPLTTILSAYHKYKHCPDSLEDGSNTYANAPVGEVHHRRPKLNGQHVYEFLMNFVPGNSFQRTTIKFLDRYSGVKELAKFFHVESKQPRSANDVDSPLSVTGRWPLFFSDRTYAFLTTSLQSCFQESFVSFPLFQTYTDAMANPYHNRQKLCDLYQMKEKSLAKYKLTKGHIYETIRYANCEWVETWTAAMFTHILRQSGSDLRSHGYEVQAYSFEMNEWLQESNFMSNMELILDAFNIVVSNKNVQIVSEYLQKFGMTDVQDKDIELNIAQVRKKILTRMLSTVFVGSAGYKNRSDNSSKLEKLVKGQMDVKYREMLRQKEGIALLRFDTDICMLIKNMTLSMFFTWKHYNIC